MTNAKTINPEETLIYKELKSKFEVQDPELWREVSENLKQVIESNNYGSVDGFIDNDGLSYSFVWCDSKQGHDYWKSITRKLNGGKNWW